MNNALPIIASALICTAPLILIISIILQITITINDAKNKDKKGFIVSVIWLIIISIITVLSIILTVFRMFF